MDFIELKADIRTDVGDGPARTLRRHGKIPAVLYGPTIQPVLLAVETLELDNALKKGSIGQSLFQLKIEGDTIHNKPVMIKELQRHPATDKYLHADFFEIAMDRKTTVTVPVVAVGKSKGVEMGGILEVIRRELEITCLPAQIPATIEIDISDLDINDSIHVEDIQLGEGIEIVSDVNFTVITVSSPKMEEVPVEEGEEAEEEVEGAEPAQTESE
ncbi:MAG: 50S ribosomal protein L25/general stress protein Ctc [Desulfobacterales bacterium]